MTTKDHIRRTNGNDGRPGSIVLSLAAVRLALGIVLALIAGIAAIARLEKAPMVNAIDQNSADILRHEGALEAVRQETDDDLEKHAETWGHEGTRQDISTIQKSLGRIEGRLGTIPPTGGNP